MLSVVLMRVIMAYCHAVLSYVLAWHLILFRKRAFMKRYWYYHMQCWKIINKCWFKILYLNIKVSVVLEIAMSLFKIKSTSLVIAKTWSYIPASCYLHTSNKIFNSKYCHFLWILLKLKPNCVLTAMATARENNSKPPVPKKPIDEESRAQRYKTFLLL